MGRHFARTHEAAPSSGCAREHELDQSVAFANPDLSGVQKTTKWRGQDGKGSWRRAPRARNVSTAASAAGCSTPRTTTMASRAFDASQLVMHATCGHADVMLGASSTRGSSRCTPRARRASGDEAAGKRPRRRGGCGPGAKASRGRGRVFTGRRGLRGGLEASALSRCVPAFLTRAKVVVRDVIFFSVASPSVRERRWRALARSLKELCGAPAGSQRHAARGVTRRRARRDDARRSRRAM